MRLPILRLVVILAASAPAAALGGAAIEAGGSDEVCSRLLNAKLASELRSRAVRPSTSGSYPNDTIWVGRRAGQTGNYWEVGVGPNRPGTSTDGVWNWDSPVKNDSLQGWWPIRMAYATTGGQTLPDDQRPWWAIDIGNNANYVINQGAGNRRTFGVVGVWHQDVGNTGAGAGKGVGWTPLEGSRSAWCGLRRPGDLTHVDPVTGNPFNADVLQFNGASSSTAGGTNKKYPGYASQWDQMLYRDLDLSGSPGTGLTLTFKLKTRMSTGAGTSASTRTGWFDKDPLAVAAGNYVKSSGNSTPPIDSFMVYVGAPVADTAGAPFVGSDGLTHQVFDPLRRWLSEVIRVNEPGTVRHRELFTTYGNRDLVVTATLSDSLLAPILAAAGNRARLVFRVKTNRGFDDDGGSVGGAYSSGGAGAAVLDSVVVNGVMVGDFEDENDIDNSPAVPATAAWKSTGKPPAVYFHPHELSGLTYEDLCGPVGANSRLCDMSGVVISMGDHDLGEACGGPFGTAEQETNDGMVSPTVCLATSGPATPNGWDLTGDMADATGDYLIWYEIYTGVFDLFYQGVSWQGGMMSYPALQSDGVETWGEMRFPACIYFNPDKQCFQNFDTFLGGRLSGLIHTSNPSGIPDSLRIILRKTVQCFRFGITTACGATDGAYFDNVALVLLDATPAVLSSEIWHWFQDTFPANEDPGLPGLAAFDTTAALVKSGLNIAPSDFFSRFDVPGDTSVVTAAGDSVRVDIVFRILPGPGNHVTIGDRTSALRRVPTSPVAAVTGDSSFWGAYLLDNGPFGTPGGHGGPWNPNVWNSARVDTAETNLFPISSRGIGGGPFDDRRWMSAYHEEESKLSILGIPRHRCFLDDTLGPAAAPNVNCSTVPAWLGTVPAGRTGWDGQSRTREGTKVIPDGLLTPGSHVEYFYRRTDLGGDPGGFVACPDTGRVHPQGCETSLDGHRWQQFSVLPDAWKKIEYGGLGQACMLVVDWADRRGDEMAWGSVADSIGATHASRRGAHDGWHAAAGADVNDPAGFEAAHLGQPGTTWDLYNVKAGESANAASGTIGSRLAYRNASPGNLLHGKYSMQGPTLRMLEAYYRVVMVLTADLSTQILGPFTGRSADDTKMLGDFLLGATAGNRRGLYVAGQGFVQSEPDPSLKALLGVELRDPSYLRLAGNPTPALDLTGTTAYVTPASLYGLRNHCASTLDVLELNDPGAMAAAYYAPAGMGAPYIASVYRPAAAPNEYFSIVDGWGIQDLRTRFGDSTQGRNLYFLQALGGAFGSLCALAGSSVTGLENPAAGRGSALVNFLSLRSNPFTAGTSSIAFGLARPDRVQVRLYDLGGRRVRTLADHRFAAGEHALPWDGADDAGRALPRGAYFAHVRYLESGFTSAKKLILLR